MAMSGPTSRPFPPIVYRPNKLPANLSSSVDMYQLNATYKNGPFFAGAAYMAVDGRNFDNYFNQPLYTGFSTPPPTGMAISGACLRL